MKICPICRTSFPTKAALAAHMPSHQGGKRRGKRQRGGGNTTMRLALKEYWGPAAKNSLSTVDCKPADSGLAKLRAHASMFETYKLTSYTVHGIRAGASTTTGIYFMGVSYKSDKHPSDSKGVAALSPMVCKSAQENATLSVPCAKLMGQPWLNNDGTSPGAVIVSNGTSADIHIWVTYSVVFNGPTGVAQTDSFDITYKTDGGAWTDERGQQINTVDIADAYAELEIGGEATVYPTVLERFRNAVRTAQEIHHTWIKTIGLIHMIIGVGRFTLPRLDVPAILHLQPRPFRATATEWRLLGFEITDSAVEASCGGAI